MSQEVYGHFSHIIWAQEDGVLDCGVDRQQLPTDDVFMDDINALGLPMGIKEFRCNIHGFYPPNATDPATYPILERPPHTTGWDHNALMFMSSMEERTKSEMPFLFLTTRGPEIWLHLCYCS